VTSTYDPEWVTERIATINAMDVDEDTRTTMRDAVLDARNALDLTEHYRTEGCPLCASRDVAEHMHMVLCNGCGKRVA
jgi:hypothetical protein